MYELYPYFTNDGSIGLFSPQDDDIYHSTYGALSESWEKFVLPSHLEDYLNSNRSVKILDICYGIGYNTKTALQVFLNTVLKNKKKILEKKIKKTPSPRRGIAQIYTDNNRNEKTLGGSNILSECIDKKYADNICSNKSKYSPANQEGKKRPAIEISISSAKKNFETKSMKITIDAIETDKMLVGLSPFFKNPQKKSLFNLFNPFKNEKQKNMPLINNMGHNKPSNKDKRTQISSLNASASGVLEQSYLINEEVNMLLIDSLVKNNSISSQIPEIKNIINKKEYKPYFNQNMLDFCNFYTNHGYIYNPLMNKSSLLHNIYYQYISKSYKNTLKVLENNEIELNFYLEDARKAILSNENTYNFIFLDAFTPTKCPCLWTKDFFKLLYKRLEDDGMILTYSSSAAIRNALIQNNFNVGKIFDAQKNKFIGTIATKNDALIEHKLNAKEIALINSKAGICFRDKELNLTNDEINSNRKRDIDQSNLKSSSQVVKEFKNG